MTRQAAWDDENGVDAHVIAVAQEALGKAFSGDRDPAQAIGVERESCRVFGRPRFDFDERQRVAATGNDIDFAAGDARAPGEDPPAVQTKPPGGEGLGAAATLFGGMATHLAERSSARA